MGRLCPQAPQPAMGFCIHRSMTSNMKRILVLTALAVGSLASAAEPVDLSLEEFKMWRHWQNAMEDERVKAMKPEKRNPAIAKDAKFKLKDMEKAVEKG